MSEFSRDRSTPTSENVDLRTLVSHAHALDAASTVELAQTTFSRLDVDFLAVVSGAKLLGLCARRELFGSLGSRFGFALHAKRPIAEFLMAAPLVVAVGTPLTTLFRSAATRGPREFYDDVVLIGSDGALVGLIPMRTLVRLQTEFLLTNLEHVEASRREIVEKNRQMEDDLRMACEVQLALLPAAPPVLVDAGRSLAFAHIYRPSGGVSGDFFATVSVSSSEIGVVICDVMGHGVRAALITAMIRAMIDSLRPIAGNPGAFLARLNQDLTRMLRRAGDLIFVTAAYAVIDVRAGRLRYAQAGHPTPLHWRATDAELVPIDCAEADAGPALGLLDDFAFATVERDFAPGDRLLLFTDGISEAADPGGEEFGVARMSASLRRNRAAPLVSWIEALQLDAASFAAGRFGDDVCLVAAELVK